MTKSIAIIGAGISGLAAGCYAQMICHNDRRAFVATTPTDEQVRAVQAVGDSRAPAPPAPTFWSSKFPGI